MEVGRLNEERGHCLPQQSKPKKQFSLKVKQIHFQSILWWNCKTMDKPSGSIPTFTVFFIWNIATQ